MSERKEGANARNTEATGCESHAETGTPLDGMELPLEHVREYDGAAEHFARHGELPLCMGSPGAIDYIQDDPEAFQERVRQFKYAQAMNLTMGV